MNGFLRAGALVGLGGILLACRQTPNSSRIDRSSFAAPDSSTRENPNGLLVSSKDGGAAPDAESTPSLSWAVLRVGDRNHNPRVMAARIENGRIMKSRDPLAGTEGVEWNCLADGRYLVSDKGAVLDVIEGRATKLGVQGVRCRGNLLVRAGSSSAERTFERYDFSTERWSSVQDEATTSLWRVEESRPATTGTSPNGRHEASIQWAPVKDGASATKGRAPGEKLFFTGVLRLRSHDGSEQTIATGFSGEVLALSSPYRRRTEILWLDNRRMIVEQRKGQLLLVTVDGHVTPMNPAIGSGPYPMIETQLWMDGAGGILYDPSATFYRVDVEKRTVEPTEWFGLGEGFEVSLRTGRVRHREQEVCGGLCAGKFDPNDRSISYQVWPGALELRCSENRTLQVCVRGETGWQRIDFGFSGRVLGWVGAGWE